jgi:hypothetical protein
MASIQSLLDPEKRRSPFKFDEVPPKRAALTAVSDDNCDDVLLHHPVPIRLGQHLSENTGANSTLVVNRSAFRPAAAKSRDVSYTNVIGNSALMDLPKLASVA